MRRETLLEIHVPWPLCVVLQQEQQLLEEETAEEAGMDIE